MIRKIVKKMLQGVVCIFKIETVFFVKKESLGKYVNVRSGMS